MSMVWVLEQLRELKAYITPQLLTGWKLVGELLPNAYNPETIPEVGELDELETFVGFKKTKFGFGRQ